MNPIFSLTLECDPSGKIDYWTQNKQVLTPMQESKYRELKIKIEALIHQENNSIVHPLKETEAIN